MAMVMPMRMMTPPNSADTTNTTTTSLPPVSNNCISHGFTTSVTTHDDLEGSARKKPKLLACNSDESKDIPSSVKTQGFVFDSAQLSSSSSSFTSSSARHSTVIAQGNRTPSLECSNTVAVAVGTATITASIILPDSTTETTTTISTTATPTSNTETKSDDQQPQQQEDTSITHDDNDDNDDNDEKLGGEMNTTTEKRKKKKSNKSKRSQKTTAANAGKSSSRSTNNSNSSSYYCTTVSTPTLLTAKFEPTPGHYTMTTDEVEARMENLRQLYTKHLKTLVRFSPEPPSNPQSEDESEMISETASVASNDTITTNNIESSRNNSRSSSPSITVQRRSGRASKPPKQFTIGESEFRQQLIRQTQRDMIQTDVHTQRIQKQIGDINSSEDTPISSNSNPTLNSAITGNRSRRSLAAAVDIAVKASAMTTDGSAAREPTSDVVGESKTPPTFDTAPFSIANTTSSPTSSTDTTTMPTTPPSSTSTSSSSSTSSPSSSLSSSSVSITTSPTPIAKPTKKSKSTKARRNSDSKPKDRPSTPSVPSSTTSSQSNGTISEAPVEEFVCPWPGCNRVFDRVKSRSAHLKWHGGSYKEDGSSGTSQPAKKKDKDKDRVPQFLFRSGDVVKLNAVGAAKFGSFGAKSVGKVEADGKLDTAVGEICYKVLFRSKGRNRMIIAANSHLRMARREEKMREAASNHVYAAGDTVLAKRPGNASGALVRGQIVSVNSELEDDVLYSFQSKGETDSVPLRAQHLHADTEITVQDLKVGDAVCANQVSKTPDVYQIGAVTQILQQRVKINFANKTPTVWRKITDVRLV